MRWLWLALGFFALGLGFAGAVLPLLPATPFFLLAAYAFSRSSPRLHCWLVTHPQFGPPIQDWQKHGAIRRSAKVAAVLAIGLTFLLSVMLGVSAIYLAVQALALASAAAFVLSRPAPPSAKPAETDRGESCDVPAAEPAAKDML